MLLASVPVRAPELVGRVRTPTPIQGLGKPSLLALPWEKSAYAAPSELILPGPGFGHAPRDHAQGTPTGPCSPFPQPSLWRRFSPTRLLMRLRAPALQGLTSPEPVSTLQESPHPSYRACPLAHGEVAWPLQQGQKGRRLTQQVGQCLLCPF